MNKHAKNFLMRGLLFGGFGPIIASIVFLCLDLSIADFALSGREVFLAIVSTYILAFVQAGASVFNQIESWSPLKSVSVHLPVIYAAYALCYVINSWIPFEPIVLLIFTVIFAVVYFAIWLSVYFAVRSFSKKLNSKLV